MIELYIERKWIIIGILWKYRNYDKLGMFEGLRQFGRFERHFKTVWHV